MTQRRRAALPTHLGDTVLDQLGRLGTGPGDAAGMADLVRAWPSAVGETIARNAWPARFTGDGTLLVHTTSSAWAFELTHLEETVRVRLGEAAPPRLRFVVGRVPERGGDPVPAHERKRVETAPGDLAEAAEIASSIGDSALRVRVARAVAASLARARETAVPADASDTLENR